MRRAPIDPDCLAGTESDEPLTDAERDARDAAEEAQEAAEEARRAARRAELARCLDRLPESEALAFRLRYVAGKTDREIAEITGCALYAAQCRVRRAVERVRWMIATRYHAVDLDELPGAMRSVHMRASAEDVDLLRGVMRTGNIAGTARALRRSADYVRRRSYELSAAMRRYPELASYRRVLEGIRRAPRALRHVPAPSRRSLNHSRARISWSAHKGYEHPPREADTIRCRPDQAPTI